MADYRVFETEQFKKDLRALAKSGQARISAKLRDGVYPHLRDHPHFGPSIRKLVSYQPETWRYRIGAWRFFCEIDDEGHIVYMTAAAHRGSAY